MLARYEPGELNRQPRDYVSSEIAASLGELLEIGLTRIRRCHPQAGEMGAWHPLSCAHRGQALRLERSKTLVERSAVRLSDALALGDVRPAGCAA
jgi:hypothetical protein